METWSSFHQNFQEIKLQNAIIYSIEYDQDTSILITVTDYGHINLHHISDLQRCTSKTLIHDNLPIYCSYFYQSRSKKILFT